MKVSAIISARCMCTRLPGESLHDPGCETDLKYIYNTLLQSDLIDEIIITSNDDGLPYTAAKPECKAIITAKYCTSWTVLLVEISGQKKADIYLYIQCSAPFVRHTDINRLLAVMRSTPDVPAATLCYPVSRGQAENPDLVKVVRSSNGSALYFSRACIPFDCSKKCSGRYWAHMDIWAYRPEAIKIFSNHEPGMLECTEKLEQLRLLQHGISIQTVEIPPYAPDTETPEELKRKRSFAAGGNISASAVPPSVASPLADIRLVITDVDGVLTDGGLYYGPDGECIKRFHAQDGLGIAMLQNAGIRVAVLSGRDCPALRRRLEDLGIGMFRLGKVEKRAACESLLREAGSRKNEALFIGDDLPDLQGFACCGLSVAVANARSEVKSAADMVLNTQGGQGAFRELADMLLHSIRSNPA